MTRRDDGFSLLETLLALVVLAAALVSLHQGLASGWKGQGQSRAQLRAVEHGRAQMARVGADVPLQVGVSSGRSADGFAWRTSISDSGFDAASDTSTGTGTAPAGRLRPTGYWITTTVSWRQGMGLSAPRTLTLRTFRISRPAHDSAR
jgi:prepilin-type N-terminal cleavage/methylation domain-containing protein